MVARTMVGLRVDEQVEVDGLDLAEHGERGYPGS
jgi:ammonia channel protein AmtB